MHFMNGSGMFRPAGKVIFMSAGGRAFRIRSLWRRGGV